MEEEKSEKPKTKKKETKAHKTKAKTVKDLAEKIKNAKTLMIVGIKNLPSKQFQEIKKTIRDKVLIKIAKKNIMLRAIKKVGKESILPLESHIQEDCAFAISDLEGYKLAGILAKNKTRIYAKAGQTAPEDIEVKAGPTNLLPGPAISELGALGIQISVEEGKISIRASKIVVKKGDDISEGAASLFQKLDIKPFKIGLVPLVIYDIQTEKIYENIDIDSEKSIENLRAGAGKALGFAQKIVYYCKETIGYLLAKANADNKVLEKLKPKEEKPVEKEPITSKEASKEKPAEAKTSESSSEKLVTDAEKKEPVTDTKTKSKEESK